MDILRGVTETEARLNRGLEVMDQVYGEGFSKTLAPTDGDPLTEDVVAHLFGDIWSRPELSIRDRRLLVMGATAALGRGDLLEVQVRGAIANGELDEEQLREVALHLQYYVGIGNAGRVRGAIESALRDPTLKQPGG
jgi:4-carboxymuconolactone decarboxylase